MYTYNVMVFDEKWTLLIGSPLDLASAVTDLLPGVEERMIAGEMLTGRNIVIHPENTLIALPFQENADTTVERLRMVFAELMSSCIPRFTDDLRMLFYDSFKSQGRALHVARMVCKAYDDDCEDGMEEPKWKTVVMRIGDSSPKREFKRNIAEIGGAL